MSERMRESLSALLDGEANELELQRVLSEIGEDSELRQTWVRYNAVHSACSGQEVGNLSFDISQSVRDAVAAEGTSQSSGNLGRLLKPFASFAVAASVAAVVVVGGQQIAQVGGGGSSSPQTSIAGVGSPVGFVNIAGATSVQANYGTQAAPTLQPAARRAYQELARQRMQRYMQEHAEHAALNSPQGLVPFARVKEIKE
ncbi:MAG: sigma-E factor negative regulatory protein RseA [Halioglobus sp.]|jgi:sigma-E factor negative regulatory protein RseA